MKSFITNKGSIGNNDITLTFFRKNKIISDEKQLTKLFNSLLHKYLCQMFLVSCHSSGTKPKTFGTYLESTSVHSVKDIVNSYKNHPSIIKIKQVLNGSDVSDSERFSFKTVNGNEIKDLLKNLDIKKASGNDTMSRKLVKLPSQHLPVQS